MKEAFIKAAEIIKRGWQQGSPARDWLGNRATPGSPEAVTYCLIAALTMAVGDANFETHANVLRSLLCTIDHTNHDQGCVSLAAWNDQHLRTAAEVIALLERAAKENAL